MKWKPKDPAGKIVSSKGNGEIHLASITDAQVEQLIKENPNYESQFDLVEPESKPVKSKE